jgi:NAD(P)-dependent dehydrogenase (short-subunit alcohol dehydrogenase family)
MSGFEGKGAVITGGANGIGLATATEFARRGARVVLADVDQPSLEQAVIHLKAQGFQAHGVMCDVRHLNEMIHLADESFRLLGQVDVVFSNAGIVVAGPLAQMTHDDWRWVIDIDLWGSIHAVEAFLPRLLEQGTGGHVAFTASFAGLMPNVGLGAYSVAKYGVVGLAENLAREVKDNGALPDGRRDQAAVELRTNHGRRLRLVRDRRAGAAGHAERRRGGPVDRRCDRGQPAIRAAPFGRPRIDPSQIRSH